MKRKVVTAIIPVKAGSTRLLNKSNAPFLGYGLLERKIRQLQRCRLVDRIVVSSECTEYLKKAESLGVGVHHRDTRLSRPETLIGDVVKEAAESVSGDVVLWAHTTSPLVGPMLYDRALECFFTFGNSYDSLVSVHRLYEFVWDSDGPVNYGIGSEHTNTQDVSPLWRVTCGIFIGHREDMIRWSYYVGKKPYRFELNKKTSIDIDDELDLHCAEEMERKYPDLSDLVYRKRVAVIGSGKVHHSRTVNKCDEVIRVKLYYPWNDGIEKTSAIWYTGDYCSPSEKERLRGLAGTVPVFWASEKTREKIILEFPDLFGETGIVPLSGTQCIYDCLQSGAKEVVLDGFDFFAERNDPRIPFETEPECFHDCRRDKTWTLKMMNRGLLGFAGEL